MHLAAGNALMDGLLAAHFRMQASLSHGQAKAQVCAAAQLSTAMHASICDAHLSSEQVQDASQTAFEQSMSAEDFNCEAAHWELMHLAAGRALMDGLWAAHLRVHAVSLQGHARAQSCTLAQFGAAKHSSIWDAHLSKEQEHWSGHADLVQSMSAEDFNCEAAHWELMHLAAGRALMDGLWAAHLRVHAVSLQGHARAQSCTLAQFGAAKHSSIWDAHLSKEQEHWSGHADLVQSTSAVVDKDVVRTHVPPLDQ